MLAYSSVCMHVCASRMRTNSAECSQEACNAVVGSPDMTRTIDVPSAAHTMQGQCVSVCVYICVYVYVCMYVYIYIYIYMCVCVCVCIYIYIYIYICMYAFLYVQFDGGGHVCI
jgi:hypothetical protein